MFQSWDIFQHDNYKMGQLQYVPLQFEGASPKLVGLHPRSVLQMQSRCRSHILRNRRSLEMILRSKKELRIIIGVLFLDENSLWQLWQSPTSIPLKLPPQACAFGLTWKPYQIIKAFLVARSLQHCSPYRCKV